MGIIRSYKPIFIMRSTDDSTLRIVDLWKFRSTKSNKWYIVEVDYFSSHFLGLKFYWKGVAASKNRYSLLTYDYEPRTIIMTCVEIMLYYFRNDDCASFGFVAAQNLDSSGEKNINKRFRFYRRMMLSLFSEDKFLQANDKENSIYLLINRKMLLSGKVTIEGIEKEISSIYEGDYVLVANSI